jgi:predicted permease
MNGFARDLRFALRSLRRNPGFAVATVLVLGIGVGAISLMFSTYNTVFLRPLPYPHPERLVWVWETTPSGSRNSLSYEDYLDFQGGVHAFRSMAAVHVFGQGRLLTGRDGAQELRSRAVSASLFPTLGVLPALGRSFVDADELRGTADVGVLSHGFWTRQFGADPSIVGRTINLDGQPIEVVGVMPSGFDYPAGTDLWVPLQRSSHDATGRGNNNFNAIGRLRDGATLEQAQVEIGVVADRIALTYPGDKGGWGAQLQTLHERYFGPAGTLILLIMGIIALVPLVACANVASLFMARAFARRGELASRLALGAPRWRIVGQLITESLVVALGGGAVGLALAYAGGVTLRHLAPAALPRLGDIGVDGHVMLFTLLIALLTVPLFGVLPALRGTDLDIGETLKSGEGRGGSGRRSTGRDGLVVAQVALSLMLMIASGLLLRGYLGLQNEDPGFRADGLLYSRVALPTFKYTTEAEVSQAWKEILGGVRSVHGVTAAGAVDVPPLGGSGPWNEVWALGHAPATAAEARGATRRIVTSGFFGAMGIPFRAGRVWGGEDEAAQRLVTVINQTAAREFFPGEDPVGRTLVLNGSNLTVLGVVGDVKEQGLGQDAPPTFYLPHWVWARPVMYVMARTEETPTGLAQAWRAAIHALEPDVPDAPLQSVSQRVSATLFQPRFRSVLVALFALVTLVLSAVGLYGVLAYFVRQHGHELGVRLALGASRGEIARLVVVRGMTVVAWGIVLGIVGGIAGSRLVQARGWLPDVDLSAPSVYVAMALVLLLVALLACAPPALRARRVAPAEVMRAE